MELRQTLEEAPDLEIVWVMADNQINARTRLFVDENGLRDRVRFLSDASSTVIDQLGLRLQDPEPMEAGVPHPTTYLLDREGTIRFVDVREDFHIWLDPALLVQELAAIP
ncbi:MAG: redoxin domain-containing protein [Proteobacteria bacterium]|nr:redoxin domain-containing protein [Pseudomonadota bacterium]